MTEALQRRESLILQSSQQQEQLDEINEANKSAENTLQAFLTETAPFHQKEGRR